jgi:hypothetical protein
VAVRAPADEPPDDNTTIGPRNRRAAEFLILRCTRRYFGRDGENKEISARKLRKSLKLNQRSVISIQERGAVMLMH